MSRKAGTRGPRKRSKARKASASRKRATHRTRHPGRRRALLAFWLLAGLLLLVRAGQVQVAQGSEWSERAANQHERTDTIPAPRGAILDRNGAPLAISQERSRVAIAPHEVEDAEATIERLAEVLDIAHGEAAKVVQHDGRWRYLRGFYAPSARESLKGMPGVYVERVMRRIHPSGLLGTQLLGVIQDGTARGGIEESFDSVLAGVPGHEVSARDGYGKEIPGETWTVVAPRSGGEVTLTIDLDVQEIALEALQTQVEATGAEGGDLLVVDPDNGEILAAVSLRGGKAGALSIINAPYEPGSTLKPFTVAALLERGLARLSDSIDTGNGTWVINGRQLNDIGAHGKFTLADALRLSSNVGVAKAAQVLTPEQHYETLRDFGFGEYTGVPLPGEVRGRLRRPQEWGRQSPASHAIGYEIGVTPLQITMAYAALANGGKLMEPRLVREVRTVDGRTEARGSRVLRSVADADVTEAIRDVLVEVVSTGTGTRAQMSTFRVAGKSGTSRAYGPRGYQPGEYFASFVGFFPADDPQLVVYVKLDRPRGGSYYGGSLAAPVTLATLEAILAARGAPLDRRALLEVTRKPERPEARPSPFGFASRREAPSGPAYWPNLPAPEPRLETATARDGEGTLLVPEVVGLSARVAIRRLHASGLRVQWEGEGYVASMQPEPGTRISVGDTVTVLARSRAPRR